MRDVTATVAAARSAAALVIHGDKSPKRPSFFCAKPARGMRWQSIDGTLSLVRCGASNRCDYCAMLAALEAAAMLRIDAHRERPTVGLTTTTHVPGFEMKHLREAERYLWRELRRRYGRIEYAGFLEWTTGKRTAGRRPHLHHLVKGLPEEGHRRLEAEVSRLWRRYTRGAWVVECRPLRTPAGAIAYLALHHHKREQGPPPGFRGRRLRFSQGYLDKPGREARADAKRFLRDGRIEWAVRGMLAADFADDDLTAHELDVVFDQALDEAYATSTAEPPRQLVRVRERQVVDLATGEVGYRVVEVVGSVK